MNEACPWCDRKAARGFPIKKPWQFYQGHFAALMNQIADKSQGPLAIVVLAEDANGEVYSYGEGPVDRQMYLAEAYAELARDTLTASEPLARKEAPCFANKLKNGIGKLFNSTLKSNPN
jgi:hypothetical protein